MPYILTFCQYSFTSTYANAYFNRSPAPRDPHSSILAGTSIEAASPGWPWVVLRVPYPLGFFTKSMGGRIDDARGLEGPWTLDDSQHARAIPHGGWQGDNEQSHAIPATTGPVGKVKGRLILKTIFSARCGSTRSTRQ